MLHPAVSAIEKYYTRINEKNWTAIATLFDIPTTLIVGPTKIVLGTPEDVTALYQGLGEKFEHEGAVWIAWDRGSFALFQVHDDLVSVKTVITRQAADGTAIKTWNCSYTLRLLGQEWLFTLLTSDDAGNAQAVR
jgi:hypothetical protein